MTMITTHGDKDPNPRKINVTFPICTPNLDVSGVKLFYFLGFGFLSPVAAALVDAPLLSYDAGSTELLGSY